MGELTTTSRSSATVLLNSLSVALRAALETPTKTGPDFDLIPQPWSLPEVVTPPMRREAREYAMAMRTLIDTPASTAALEEWLGKLGLLVAGNMAAGDAMAKMGAYSRMLSVPECLLTRKTLDAAAREFKWFPAYAELVAMFDRHVEDLKVRMDRARRIAAVEFPAPRMVTSGGGGGRLASEMSPEEREAFLASVMAPYRKQSGRSA
jgi:hypothetical protein